MNRSNFNLMNAEPAVEYGIEHREAGFVCGKCLPGVVNDGNELYKLEQN